MSTSPARSANVDAVVQATSIAWADWTARLDAAGGRDLPHPELARLALEAIRARGGCANPEWWAQGVAVAYEQHIGRRLPGQRADGTFSPTASRTVPGTRAEASDRVVAVVAAARGDDGGRLRGVALAADPTESTTAKRTFWRAVLEDGSRTEVAVEDRPATAGGASRAGVTVTQSKVATPEEAAAWKAFWKDLLGRL